MGFRRETPRDDDRRTRALLDAEGDSMASTFIHDDQTPDGRPAADEELAVLLGGMTTADGTSILDIWRDTRDQD